MLVLALPYLQTIGTRPMHKTELAAQIRQLARKEGVGSTPVRIDKVRDQTTAANAMATGIGPSAGVFIWDTFLDGRFTPGQIKVVAAHEFGHVAHRHIWKGLGWSALIYDPRLLRRGRLDPPPRWDGQARGGAVCAARPRRLRPADHAVRERGLAPLRGGGGLVGLEGDSGSARREGVFRKFTLYDLSQPNPPGWSYVWIDDHPTVVQRIAMARAWRSTER